MSLVVRNTARAVLLNDKSELLLMKIVLPDRVFWCTVGGGMEPGETPKEAIIREAKEEIGFSEKDIDWVRPIWYGEHVINLKGQPVPHRETFILGYTQRSHLDYSGLMDDEKSVVKEYRWWSLEDMKKTGERIVPASLAGHMGAIISGQIPESVQVIDLSDKPAQ